MKKPTLILTLSLITSLPLLAQVNGAICAGRAESGETIRVDIVTEGDFDQLKELKVSIIETPNFDESEQEIRKTYTIENKNVSQFYVGCIKEGCSEIFVGLKAYAQNFYPVILNFSGPDFIDGKTTSWQQTLIQLESAERKKNEDNKMNVWTGKTGTFPVPKYLLNDIICVRTIK